MQSLGQYNDLTTHPTCAKWALFRLSAHAWAEEAAVIDPCARRSQSIQGADRGSLTTQPILEVMLEFPLKHFQQVCLCYGREFDNLWTSGGGLRRKGSYEEITREQQSLLGWHRLCLPMQWPCLVSPMSVLGNEKILTLTRYCEDANDRSLCNICTRIKRTTFN